jgi:hypothetical protein
MFELVFWSFAIVLAPLILPLSCPLIAMVVRNFTSTPHEPLARPRGGDRSDRDLRCRPATSRAGPGWPAGSSGRVWIDEPEERRYRPARLHSRSR